MKLLIKILFVPIILLAFDASAANATFNHKGIQKGAISESCYRDPYVCLKPTLFTFALFFRH